MMMKPKLLSGQYQTILLGSRATYMRTTCTQVVSRKLNGRNQTVTFGSQVPHSNYYNTMLHRVGGTTFKVLKGVDRDEKILHYLHSSEQYTSLTNLNIYRHHTVDRPPLESNLPQQTSDHCSPPYLQHHPKVPLHEALYCTTVHTRASRN